MGVAGVSPWLVLNPAVSSGVALFRQVIATHRLLRDTDPRANVPGRPYITARQSEDRK